MVKLFMHFRVGEWMSSTARIRISAMDRGPTGSGKSKISDIIYIVCYLQYGDV